MEEHVTIATWKGGYTMERIEDDAPGRRFRHFRIMNDQQEVVFRMWGTFERSLFNITESPKPIPSPEQNLLLLSGLFDVMGVDGLNELLIRPQGKSSLIIPVSTRHIQAMKDDEAKRTHVTHTSAKARLSFINENLRILNPIIPMGQSIQINGMSNLEKPIERHAHSVWWRRNKGMIVLMLSFLPEALWEVYWQEGSQWSNEPHKDRPRYLLGQSTHGPVQALIQADALIDNTPEAGEAWLNRQLEACPELTFCYDDEPYRLLNVAPPWMLEEASFRAWLQQQNPSACIRASSDSKNH